MAEPEAAGRARVQRAALSLVAAACLALAAGCAGGGPPPELGDRPTEASEQIEKTKRAAGDGAQVPEPTPPPEELADRPPTPRTQEAARRPDPTAAVHFETANPEEGRPRQPTLFEAAEAERQRRQSSPPPSVVITDENLGDYAKGGQLSEMSDGGGGGEAGASGTGTSGTGASSTGASPGSTDKETYWRTRVRNARLAWRAAHDRVGELEDEVARLRYDFYAQDDPVYRDQEIKPAWDRAAVELTQARLRTADLETQVELVLAEGLDAGALPGWLREGIDFEPESTEDPAGEDGELSFAEVIEPPILEDPPR